MGRISQNPSAVDAVWVWRDALVMEYSDQTAAWAHPLLCDAGHHCDMIWVICNNERMRRVMRQIAAIWTSHYLHH